MAIRLALVIVNYNAGDDIIRCLQSVMQQHTPADEVYVVDNASSDGSLAQIQSQFPHVSIYAAKQNLGFAAANNRIFSKLSTSEIDWVVLLNPDTIAEPTWLTHLVERMHSADNCVNMLASQLRVLDEAMPMNQHDLVLDGAGDAYHVSGLCWRRGHGRKVALEHAVQSPIFAPCAAAAAYRLSALKQVDGFDERYFCYNEDVDLGFRMRLIGGQCQYVESAVVYHIGSKITGKNSDFSVYYGHRNLTWTFIKNMPLSLLLMYLPQHLIMSMFLIMYFSSQGRVQVICRAKWHALKHLPAIWASRRHIQRKRSVSAKDLRQHMVRNFLLAYQRGKR